MAVFAVNSGGSVTVRASGDYLSAMIRQSGGKYLAAEKASEESMRSTLNIQMEDFYRIAKSADVLIYNSTIEEPISAVGQLKKRIGMDGATACRRDFSRTAPKPRILWKI